MEPKKIVKALERKGFRPDPDRVKRDHVWFRLYVGGLKTEIATKISHGKKKYDTLGPPLVKKMADQVGLAIPDFRKLVSCTLSGEEYVAVLRDAGLELDG